MRSDRVVRNTHQDSCQLCIITLAALQPVASCWILLHQLHGHRAKISILSVTNVFIYLILQSQLICPSAQP